MQISKGIEIIDLALLIENNLVICDTHIGFEEYLNKTGVMVPRFQFKEIILRLEKILDVINNKTRKNSKGIFCVPGMQSIPVKINLQKIIINGDVKHEFGTISEQEWRHTLRLLDFLKKYCKEIILIKGNHDTILGPIAKKRNVKIKKYHKIKDVLILHGNKIPKIGKEIKTIIIGHEHPAIGLREAARVELYKCFLKGKWQGKTLIVQPSFNLVTEGTDVLKEKLLSPFLKDISKFDVFVVEDKVYEFGKLKDLGRVR